MHHSKFLHGLATLFIVAALAAVGSAIVMALWNSVVIEVCGFMAVTFWQSLGLFALGLTFSGVIFLLFAMIVHAFGHHHHAHRQELFKKWQNMTEEQRRDFLASRGFSVDEK